MWWVWLWMVEAEVGNMEHAVVLKTDRLVLKIDKARSFLWESRALVAAAAAAAARGCKAPDWQLHGAGRLHVGDDCVAEVSGGQGLGAFHLSGEV